MTNNLSRYVCFSSSFFILRLGLTNSMLSICPPFDRQSVLAIETFLNNFPTPICFVGKKNYIRLTKVLLT